MKKPVVLISYTDSFLSVFGVQIGSFPCFSCRTFRQYTTNFLQIQLFLNPSSLLDTFLCFSIKCLRRNTYILYKNSFSLISGSLIELSYFSYISIFRDFCFFDSNISPLLIQHLHGLLLISCADFFSRFPFFRFEYFREII